MAPAASAVDVLGVEISHPEKLLWPHERISKLDLARYYESVGPTLLQYVKDRPLTLRPFPRGVTQPGFYLKNAPKNAPDWIKTFADVAESTRQTVHFVVARDVRTLIWGVQFNSIEIHPWLARVDRPDTPDWGMVDLDPPDNAPWSVVARCAAVIRARLERDGLQVFPKVSGQDGLHLLIPLARRHAFVDVRAYFERVAFDAIAEAPDILTRDYAVRARGERVLFDYAQNARGKTTVAPYSVRPKASAPVSVPITWDEVDDPAMRSNRWTMRNTLDRLEHLGDILAPALTLHQSLPKP